MFEFIADMRIYEIHKAEGSLLNLFCQHWNCAPLISKQFNTITAKLWHCRERKSQRHSDIIVIFYRMSHHKSKAQSNPLTITK